MDGHAIEQLPKGISTRRVWRLLQFFPSQFGGRYLKLAAPRPEFLGLPTAVGNAIIIESAEDRGVKINPAQLRLLPGRYFWR